VIVLYVRFVLFASAFEVGWMIDRELWRVAGTSGVENYVSRLPEQHGQLQTPCLVGSNFIPLLFPLPLHFAARGFVSSIHPSVPITIKKTPHLHHRYPDTPPLEPQKWVQTPSTPPIRTYFSPSTYSPSAPPRYPPTTLLQTRPSPHPSRTPLRPLFTDTLLILPMEFYLVRSFGTKSTMRS